MSVTWTTDITPCTHQDGCTCICDVCHELDCQCCVRCSRPDCGCAEEDAYWNDVDAEYERFKEEL